MRPIDADALLYCLEKVQEEFLDNGDYIAVCIIKTVIKLLKTEGAIPTIDVEPVRHGRWETDKEDIEWGNSLKRKHCTNCGSRPHFDKEKREFVLTKYCPNCGAKMDAKED